MTEKREILGLWWLPEKPDEKWVGTLACDEDKSPHLTVTVPKGFQDFQSAPAVVHGHDQHGKPITLLFPGLPKSRGGMAISQMEFSAGYAVLGLELPNQTDFKINSLILRLQHLFEWGNISGFDRNAPSTVHDIQILYKRPAHQSFTVDADTIVELHPAFSTHSDLRGHKIEEDLIVSFDSKQGLNLRRCQELLNSIRHLLHFAVLKPVYPLSIKATKAGHGVEHDGHFYHHDIEVWNSIIRERVESEFPSKRWVFQFKDVQADFGKFIAKWLKYLKRFDEALACYFSTIYHRLTSPLEHLSLTQAFDAYHSIKFNSHNEKFEPKIRQLTEANKQHLKGLVDDPADFAKTVMHNRHYYTHHNPKWKKDGRVLELSGLLRLNEKLRLLFQMCVLADMGIPSDRFPRLRRQLAFYSIDYV
jgi:hypothetical protein